MRKLSPNFEFYLSLVKYLRDLFSIRYINFLMIILFFLNTSQAFGQRARPLPHLFRCVIHYMKTWGNGELNGVVFLDIRKAFDSINHTILLHKMKVQFGITKVELDWFSSYLTNREQVCLVNGITSTPKKIVCGVPQG